MKIDISIENNIIFKASRVKSIDRTATQLKKEALNFSELLNNIKKQDEISYKTALTDNNSTTTTFKDPTNGKMVAVSLKKTIISKLEQYFGKDDIRRNQDGTVTLDNKAESYVASWFEDIAYKREFLKADVNRDGQLSRDEYNQTKNNFELTLKFILNDNDKVSVSVEESLNKSYVKAIENDFFTSIYRSDNRAINLDDELNMTLSINKDFDSKIDIKEAYSTNKNITMEELILSHINSLSIENTLKNKAFEENVGTLNFNLSEAFNDILSIVVTLLLNSENEKVKNTLEKLKQNYGDPSTLNLVEIQIVQDILKLESRNDKYKMKDIENILESLDKYEIKNNSMGKKDKVGILMNKLLI
ncbi:EF-hand domain-containing protein [Halarcobacter bivalviorum]|uniref:hypothetical protein n=1 Tax=Halarcobacter bivalviorum TaxID=663364 RepID=UPI00100B13FD|nr:hypothetical protein [Halarcobacter bivalviorum]RXK05066.1 hypothetical protein CRU97_09360 [Halarcobacter bivalviorum]